MRVRPSIRSEFTFFYHLSLSASASSALPTEQVPGKRVTTSPRVQLKRSGLSHRLGMRRRVRTARKSVAQGKSDRRRGDTTRAGAMVIAPAYPLREYKNLAGLGPGAR
jgi:hypothetical protein